jgi:predicted GIY-YIG superfamily endonuclease
MSQSLMGVYVIENTETGRSYVGASLNVFQRLREHIGMLTKGQHPTARLQDDWQRRGPCRFTFRVAELVQDRGA